MIDTLKDSVEKDGKQVVVVGSGFDASQLPDELKGKVKFVENDELSDQLKELKKNEPYPDFTSHTGMYTYSDIIPYAYEEGMFRKKIRNQSNKKYVKRKKAKNGKAGKKRKK